MSAPPQTIPPVQAPAPASPTVITWEQHIAALTSIFKVAAPTLLAGTPKISTKIAALLTTIVSITSYATAHVAGLPDWAQVGIFAISTGVAAFLTAEET